MPRARRLRGFVAVALGVLLVPVAWLPSATADPDVPAAAFDWSMPERFGPDRNGDGLIDYVDGATDKGPTGYTVNPSSWRVDLDACASVATGSPTFLWRVVDQPDASNPIDVKGGPACDAFWMDVPELGAYRVELQVDDGGVVSPMLRQEVVVQDWLIVSLGDSYGSGEGVPDVPIDQSKLVAANDAWNDVEAKWNAVLTVKASADPLKASIALWKHYTDETAAYCDVFGPRADVEKCTEYIIKLAAQTAKVLGELVAFGIAVVIETAAEAYAAVQAVIDASVKTWEAADQIARGLTGDLAATWQDQRCHRSANAGSALAARALEQADPRTSVTFVHLACSGATMTYGLLGWYEGPESPAGVSNEACDAEGKDGGWSRPSGCIAPQIEVAKQLTAGREIDAVYVSIGGNDAHFSNIIKSCIVLEPCTENSLLSDPGPTAANLYCPALAATQDLSIRLIVQRLCDDFLRPIDVVDTAPELLEEGINGSKKDPPVKKYPGLSVGYGRINDALMGTESQAGLLPPAHAARVYIPEYVDAVKDDSGTYCDFDTMGFETLPGMSSVESQYVDTTIVPTLAQVTSAAADTHGWTFLEGIYSGFTNKGYCADDHYLVRFQESLLIQGRYHGMVHPNQKGHAVYRDVILPRLHADLYPTGDVRQPRRADQRPFADTGGPWSVVEGDSITLTNESWDSDGDLFSYAWSLNRPDKAELSSTTAPMPTLFGIDDTSGTLQLTVTDEDGSRTATVMFEVLNAPPEIEGVAGLDSPILVDTLVTVTVPFTDPGVLDTHTMTIDWGDGTTSAGEIDQGAGSGTATATHTYAATGIYTVTVEVTDDDGDSDLFVHEYAIVYDPEGGSVTGGGWFDSPSGAHTPHDLDDADVTGRASFGFSSKYAKGATVPSGHTSFVFPVAGLSFSSTSFEWMVVSGSRTTYRALGTLNGTAGHAIVVAVSDGGPKGVDHVRVRITEPGTGDVVYDSQSVDGIDAAAAMPIGAGAITVRRPKT